MTCDCYTEINAKLKEKNLKLVGAALTMPEFKTRFYIATNWIDRAKAPKGKKNSPPNMFVTYCPFCGKPAVDPNDPEPEPELPEAA